MFLQEHPGSAPTDSETYPLGEKREPKVSPTHASALVALSHTPLEHRLYSAMLVRLQESPIDISITARQLLEITGIRSLSTIRRGLEGLVLKLSVERSAPANGNGKKEHATVYRVYQPYEVVARRRSPDAQSNHQFNLFKEPKSDNGAFDRAMTRVVDNAALSRREAQVTLCCIEGLSNAEIGRRLDVSEQTIKFHLRNVFIKFGVKRRTELISRLLM